MRAGTKRKKDAIDKGYQARMDGKPISENPYKNLGKRYLSLSGYFEAGWIKADVTLSK